VLQYRTFRNTDPPRLVEVWNEAFPGRSAVSLRTATPFERFVLAKPYFDPAGLIVAEEDGHCLGFVHAGLLEAEARGVISLIAVRPSRQRQGIGAELLRRSEEYLQGRGARAIFAGAAEGCNPFYFGLYGGAICSGFLLSDPAAEPFFLKHGYRVQQTLLVLQRPLDVPLRVSDPRFATQADRAKNQEELVAALAPRFAERTAADWLAEMDRRGVPSAPINTYADILADPQVAAMGLVRALRLPNGAETQTVAFPLAIAGHESGIYRAPPALGAHTEEVFAEWLGEGAQPSGVEASTPITLR
jgi:GNAT superfamily N-acetyltransferase